MSRQLLLQLRQQIAQLQGSIPRHVAAQILLPLLIRTVGHYSLLDARESQQSRFNFAEFDPEPANFHLIVNPADEVDVAVFQPAGQIACSVQTFARHKRAVRKLLGG